MSSREHAEMRLNLLTGNQLRAFRDMWLRTARSDHLPPSDDYAARLQMGGRGAGKTLARAEWVRGLVNGGLRRIALVGPTDLSAREVMIEGESRLCHISYPSQRPVYIPRGAGSNGRTARSLMCFRAKTRTGCAGLNPRGVGGGILRVGAPGGINV